jgi:hypothetical protein
LGERLPYKPDRVFPQERAGGGKSRAQQAFHVEPEPQETAGGSSSCAARVDTAWTWESALVCELVPHGGPRGEFVEACLDLRGTPIEQAAGIVAPVFHLWSGKTDDGVRIQCLEPGGWEDLPDPELGWAIEVPRGALLRLKPPGSGLWARVRRWFTGVRGARGHTRAGRG